jgi:hypothetical protein
MSEVPVLRVRGEPQEAGRPELGLSGWRDLNSRPLDPQCDDRLTDRDAHHPSMSSSAPASLRHWDRTVQLSHKAFARYNLPPLVKKVDVGSSRRQQTPPVGRRGRHGA